MNGCVLVERLTVAVGGLDNFLRNWSWRSHSAEKRALSAIADAAEMLSQGSAQLSNLGADAEQVEEWTAKGIRLWLAYEAAGARTANPMITGPANFPVTRNQKALNVERKRAEEWFSYASGARNWFTRRQRSAERAAKSVEASTAKHRALEFDGVQLVQNTTLDRIQLLFVSKPDAETIALLKQSAFRWSPREGAWQRKNTNNGVQSAYRVLKSIGHVAGKLVQP